MVVILALSGCAAPAGNAPASSGESAPPAEKQVTLQVLVHQNPPKDYYPITRGMIVFQGVYGSNWPTLAAAVLLMTLPMVVIFLVLQRYIVSGLTAGAVKG